MTKWWLAGGVGDPDQAGQLIEAAVGAYGGIDILVNADVIVFIASPRAYWINGRNIPVDGLEQPHAPLDRRPY